MPLSLVFTIFLVSACQTEPEPIKKDVVITSTKHVATKKGDFESMSFQCCDTNEASMLLQGYLALTKALAADDDQKTAAAVDALTQHIQKPVLSNEGQLTALVNAITRWQQIERKAIQQDLADASTAMINYAKSHKSDKGTTVIVAFCPMAPEGPSRWLQTENVISNPYFGSEMLTCGVFEE